MDTSYNQQAIAYNAPDTGSSPVDNSIPSSSTLSQIRQTLHPDQPQAPTAQPNQGNWLERLLPTIGSVALPLIGAALAPETGGLSLLATTAGEAALGGLGGALGKTAQDISTGNKIGGDVLTSGLEGAGGSLLGAGLSKGLGAAGGVLTKMGTQGAEKAAAKSVVPDYAMKEAYFGGVPKTVKNVNNFGMNEQAIQKAGLDKSNPYDWQHYGKQGFIYENVLDKGMTKAGAIDTSELNKLNTENIGSQLAGKSKLTIDNPLAQAAQNAGVEITDNMNAADVRKISQNLFTQKQAIEGQLAKAQGSYADTSAFKSDLEAVNQAKDAVDTALFEKNTKLNDFVKNYTVSPEEAANIKSQAGETLGQQIIDNLNNMKNGRDLRSSMAPHAQADSISKHAITDIENQLNAKRAQMRDQIESGTYKQTGQKIAEGGNNLANLASIYEGTVGGHPLALGVPAAMKALSNPAAQTATGGILSKLGGGKLPAILGGVVGTSPQTVAGQAGQGQEITGASMNQDNIYNRALQEAMATPLLGGMSNVSTLLPMATKYNAAQQAISNLQNYFNAAGGAQGPIMGNLSQLGSMLTGGPAAQYQQQAQAAQAAIAQALGVQPNQVTLPTITQNQAGAQASLQNIQNLLAALGGNSATAPAR